MFLKYLELQGFKSFPDKARLNFAPGLTAVVGPNGSGKSNISDAVRWVLGEQSTKALRGGKMEDVIFNGTALRHAFGYAEVCLGLDNKDRSLAVDSDEVTVSRKYYRNGDSEYRLCGKVCRLKDINELFMDTGLGRDGYSLIGQGKIAEIVGSNPVKRRSIFEEAAGISKFRYRKEEAENSLARADENLLRLRDNLSSLEERVGPLLEQSEKAKKYLEYYDEKKSLEISICMRTLQKLKAQLAEQNSSIGVYQGEYDSLDGEYSAAEERINALAEQIYGLEAAVEEKRGGISENEAASSALTARAAVCENEISHCESELLRISKEYSELSDSGSAGDSSIQKKRGELDAKKEDSAALQKQGEALFENERGLNAEKQNILSEKAAAEEKVSAAETEISHINVVLATAENDKNQYKERLEQLALSAEQKQSLLSGYKAELLEVNDLLEEIEDKTESLNNSGSGVALKRKLRGEQLAALEERRGKDLREAENYAQRAKLLQDLERNMEGFGQSVKFVLDQGAAGRLRGILDPVSKRRRLRRGSGKARHCNAQGAEPRQSYLPAADLR